MVHDILIIDPSLIFCEYHSPIAHLLDNYHTSSLSPSSGPESCLLCFFFLCFSFLPLSSPSPSSLSLSDFFFFFFFFSFFCWEKSEMKQLHELQKWSWQLLILTILSHLTHWGFSIFLNLCISIFAFFLLWRWLWPDKRTQYMYICVLISEDSYIPNSCCISFGVVSKILPNFPSLPSAMSFFFFIACMKFD